MPIRMAGGLVALEGVLGLAFAVALAVRSGSTQLGAGAVLGQAGFFLVAGGALAAAGWGLATGRRWARTPAIVTQLLLLPVVYSLIGPSHQLVLGLLTGGVVFTTFMLLISERARVWALDLPPPEPPD